MTIQAYATSTSVFQGNEIKFCVSTSTGDEVTVNVNVLKEGWESIGPSETFTPTAPYPQVIPFDAGENGCHWPVSSYKLKIGEKWPSSLYRVTFSLGREKCIVEFIVRAKVPISSKILYCWPITTTQAYNNFHGNLYDNRYLAPPEDKPPEGQYTRLRKVSFDRPNESIERWMFDDREMRLMQWLQHEGLHVDSCSSVDLHADPSLLSNYNLLLSVGHDEYWSKEMRDNVEAFIAAGGNAAFFSANTCWWQVRFEDQNRTMICYKSAVEDPLTGIDNSRITVNWATSPLNRPENRLTGVSYRYGAGAWTEEESTKQKMREAEYEVKDSADWVFSGTSLVNGSKFGKGIGGKYGIIGYETDAVNLAEGSVTPTGEDGTPTNFKVLATADLRTWRENGWGGHATMGYYQNVGTVFTAGTLHWALNLLATPRDSIVETITRNVIKRLSDRIPGERWTTIEIAHPEEDEWKEINTGGEIPITVSAMTAHGEGHLFAAATDGRLLRRSPTGSDGPWQDLGPYSPPGRITAMGSNFVQPGLLMAAMDGKLYTRPPVIEETPWTMISDANNVLGLACPVITRFAVTSLEELFYMEVGGSLWKKSGAAPTIKALTSWDFKLFAVNTNNRLLCREDVKVDVHWIDIGETPANAIALACYYGRLFLATEDGKLYFRSLRARPSPQRPGNLLFYKQGDGVGEVGSLEQNGSIHSLQRFPDSNGNLAFRKGWTHIVPGSPEFILFYDSTTGDGASGKLDSEGSFATLKSLSGFKLNWSHIVRVGDCLFLLYNSVTGGGAIGRLDGDGSFKTLRDYSDGSFSVGWTDIVSTSDDAILFYNNKTGHVETGLVDDSGFIQTTSRAILARDFTNIAAAGHSLLFFYNTTDGSAQLIRLRRGENFEILKSWPGRVFSPNWTHVIAGSNGLLLFYNEKTGWGSTGGFIVGIKERDSEFMGLKDYGPNFSDGWTKIVGL